MKYQPLKMNIPLITFSYSSEQISVIPCVRRPILKEPVMVGNHLMRNRFCFVTHMFQDSALLIRHRWIKKRIDIFVNMAGGGYAGQAGAVLLGIARALTKADPSLEKALREHGYLTRDSRMKERKKPGQRGARRRFQFSKR